MRRSRRNHSAHFKAEVALADQRGDMTLAQQRDVHANQIVQWRRQAVENLAAIFYQGTEALL